jgi:hypothetical protein
LWKPRKKIFGTWTVCIHPNTVDKKYIEQLELFIKNNLNHINTADLSLNMVREDNIYNLVYNYWWNFKFAVFRFVNR